MHNVILGQLKTQIDKLINEYLESAEQNKMLEMISYAVLDGKRVRAIMALKCAEVFDLNINVLKNYLIAIELFHAYTLVHDDLPALDNDDFRRGKLSAHKKFGEANAILLGDSLQSMAFALMSEKNTKIKQEWQLNAINAAAEMIGYKGLAYGQLLDIENSDTKNIELITEIHMRKTAEFFVFCCSLGAILSGAEENVINKFRSLGACFGMFFQLRDDITDHQKDFKQKHETNILNAHNSENIEESRSRLATTVKQFADDLGVGFSIFLS